MSYFLSRGFLIALAIITRNDNFMAISDEVLNHDTRWVTGTLLNKHGVIKRAINCRDLVNDEFVTEVVLGNFKIKKEHFARCAMKAYSDDILVKAIIHDTAPMLTTLETRRLLQQCSLRTHPTVVVEDVVKVLNEFDGKVDRFQIDLVDKLNKIGND